MKTTTRICALAATAAALLPATAFAAPVTVNLRIEGPSSTLFEGPITTDVRPFHFTGDTNHTCDATDANLGTDKTASVTRGTVLAAAIDNGLAVTGAWSKPYQQPSFSSIAGTSVAYDGATGAYLVEYLNGDNSGTGACLEKVHDGDEVLFVYGAPYPPPNYDYTPLTLLKLNAPKTVAPGATTTATVTDYAGQPIAGATVEGQTSAADGKVVIGPFAATGPHTLRAEKKGATRSATSSVCVTTGSDGACGTTLAAACSKGDKGGNGGLCGNTAHFSPTVHVTNVSNTTYSKAKAPREIKGVAAEFDGAGQLLGAASGLKEVRLRITLTRGGKCFGYDGVAERFTRIKSCATGQASFFTVGKTMEWSYLLPRALNPGKYRVEAFAIDSAGNADRVLRAGLNAVDFRVK